MGALPLVEWELMKLFWRLKKQMFIWGLAAALLWMPSPAVALIDAPFIDDGLDFGEPDPPQPSVAELRLLKNGFMVTHRTFHQVFEPYINTDTPVFITTDTVLNAFHVLWRESLYRVESLNIDRLTLTLKWIWSQIEPDEDPHRSPESDNSSVTPRHKTVETTDARLRQFLDMRQAARQRARLTIAVALYLMDNTALQLSGQLKKKVEIETERILRAEGDEVPVWSKRNALPRSTFDYTSYQPPGFYKLSDNLSRYYKAVKWLQNVPFRVAEDDELLAILILGQTLNVANQMIDGSRLDARTFFSCYRELAGWENRWDLLVAAQIVRDRPGNLDTVRRYLATVPSAAADETPPYQPVQPSRKGSKWSDQTRFHVLAPPVAPDPLLFQTTGAIDESKHWPSGLEIMAVLGSQLAEQRLLALLPENQKDSLLQALKEAAPWFKGKTLYHQYLYCLAALLDEPEPDVPFFMVSDPWLYKNINTALAGWTQFRGHWSISSQQDAPLAVAADVIRPQGLVEPAPEFYARFDELVVRSMSVLERCGVFVTAQFQIAADLRFTAQLIRDMKYPQEGPLTDHFNETEINRIEHALLSLAALVNVRYLAEDFRQRRKVIIDQIEALAGQIQGGRYDQDPTFQAMVLETRSNLRDHWYTLSQMCRRLEVLSHKQLRGVNFNDRDNFFIAEFGLKLSALMIDNRGTQQIPNVTVPMLIHTYPKEERNQALYTAIGYPQEIVVLYPFGGKVIRCYGAVLPYFEFISSDRLSDDEWNARLADGKLPQYPAWFKNVITPQQLSKAVE